MLDNPGAERVKNVAALATRAARRKQGAFLAEGPQSVREALTLWLRRWEPEADDVAGSQTAQRTGVDDAGEHRIQASKPPEDYLPALDALYFTPEALAQHPDVEALLDRARGVLFDPGRNLPREARFFLREATAEVLAAMSDAETSQGLLAVCRPPAIAFEGLDSLLVGMSETFVRLAADGTTSSGLTVDYAPVRLAPVLVGLQDPGNVGTVIRTADAVGAGVVVLTPGSADPWAPKVVRAAAGSHFHVPIATGIDPGELTTFLRDNQVQVLAADGHAEITLDQLQTADAAGVRLDAPTVWLLGHEAHGLTEDHQAMADARIALPLYGQAESLNVAVAGAVCLYASAMAQHSGASGARGR